LKKLLITLLTLVLVVAPMASLASEIAVSGDIYHGFGATAVHRLGPGRDATETPRYSVNISTASVLFDAEGRILYVLVDVYEFGTPNYPSATFPKFSGWPGTEGYNVVDPETREVIGISENTPELFAQEVDNWTTKRERGASYAMRPDDPSMEWDKQMDFFEEWMVGQTVAEVRVWNDRFTNPRNGRVLNPTMDVEQQHEDDLAALAAMTEEEIAMLTDMVSGATMALTDPHGLMLEAIEKAYENRVLVFSAGN